MHMQKNIIQIDKNYQNYIFLIMLEIRLLHALIVLAEERSVTSAAQRLSVSQPAMSTTLRRLREIFKDPLFVRASSGLIPTDAADNILKQAREIVGLAEALEVEQTPFCQKTDKLELRISASDFALSSVLPALIANLQKDAPFTTVKVTPLDLDTIEQLLEAGTLDFAVLPDFLAPENMQTRRLFEADFVYLMRDGHQLLQETVTLGTLSECEHLRVAPGRTFGSNRIDKLFKEAGFARNIRLTVSNYSSAFDVVRNTDLVMLAPRNVINGLGHGFSTCEPPFRLDPILMSLIWHSKRQNSKAHSWARDYLAQTVRLEQGRDVTVQ